MRGGADPTDIGAIIEALKNSSLLGQNLEEAQIWEQWPDLVGPHLLHHGRPRGIKDGRLTIETDSATWTHRYAYNKPAIIEAINRLTGRELVSEIFLTLAPEAEETDPQDAG